jgi:ATP-dependent Clp protease ATP-binding subunit ClpA
VDELPALTPRMRRSLHRAREIAEENGQAVIGTEHLLLAFLDDRAGIAGMTLHSVGNATALRAELVHIITSEGYKTPSRTTTRPESE